MRSRGGRSRLTARLADELLCNDRRTNSVGGILRREPPLPRQQPATLVRPRVRLAELTEHDLASGNGDDKSESLSLHSKRKRQIRSAG